MFILTWKFLFCKSTICYLFSESILSSFGFLW